MANTITAGNGTNNGLAVASDATGALNILTGSGAGTAAISIDSSQNVTVAGNATITGTLSATNGITGSLKSGTVTPSSGTALTYSSLQSGVKRITVMIASLQTSSTTTPVIQLSSSSTFKTSGYLSATTGTGASTLATVNGTSGFSLSNSTWSSSVVINGSVTFTLLNSSTNIWTVSGVLGRSDGTNASFIGGSVTLAGTLDGIRLYIDGTQTFTAGSINIIYE